MPFFRRIYKHELSCEDGCDAQESSYKLMLMSSPEGRHQFLIDRLWSYNICMFVCLICYFKVGLRPNHHLYLIPG